MQERRKKPNVYPYFVARNNFGGEWQDCIHLITRKNKTEYKRFGLNKLAGTFVCFCDVEKDDFVFPADEESKRRIARKYARQISGGKTIEANFFDLE